MLYKMHCNLVAMDQQKYLEPAGRSSRYTHRLSYKVPASETYYHLYPFLPNTFGDWNSLPLNVVEAQSINFFAKPSWAYFDYWYLILIISYYQ